MLVLYGWLLVDVDKSTELERYFMKSKLYQNPLTLSALTITKHGMPPWLASSYAPNDQNLRQELLDLYDELPTHEYFDGVERSDPFKLIAMPVSPPRS
jgi:hypothetical protein